MSAASAAPLYSSLLRHLADPAVRSLLPPCLAALALKLARLRDATARLAIWKRVLFAAFAMPSGYRFDSPSYFLCGNLPGASGPFQCILWEAGRVS